MKREEILDINHRLSPDARWAAVIHYDEVGLKGKNRGRFEDQLRRNILRALSDIGGGAVQRYFGRMVLFLPKEFDWQIVESRLQKVLGIAYFAPALFVEQNMEHITAAALALTAHQPFQSFRVQTKRADKQFPLTSEEVNRVIGAAIQESSGARVDLDNPELTCYLEIFNQNAVVYIRRCPAWEGLPPGVSEKAVALLSAGIDSPVAAWKMMKRGVQVTFVHFHSVPATSEASIEKCKKIVEILTSYQYRSKLYLVPVLEIQNQIRTEAPEDLWIIFLRRCLMRLAERIAVKERAPALITGESVGQVSSQTLSNIRAIHEGIKLPVLRPLCGENKRDIVTLARQIGTFQVSIEPYEDCCSLFLPQHPQTRAHLKETVFIEKHLNLKPLLQKALQNTTLIRFKYP
ncbi:MAG: tRNA 4-thiouridine(8) synthase ThiI [Calditrichia bacterium]